MLRLFFAAIASIALLANAQASGKILLGPHIGDATIISITGVNSDRAIVRFRREPDDEAETCERELSEVASTTEIAACVKRALQAGRAPISTRRAFCSRSTLYTEFGNYSMVNSEKEKESIIDGKPYRPIRTDWMDHRTGKIVGNCSACNSPQLIDTFKILCPVFYSQLFEGLEPY